MADEISFVPVIRLGKVGIVGTLQTRWQRVSVTDELDLAGLSYSFRDINHIILEAPCRIEMGQSVESLFETIFDENPRRMTFRVLKSRVPTLLAPYQSPDPYTDDHLIILTFDDLMALYLSV